MGYVGGGLGDPRSGDPKSRGDISVAGHGDWLLSGNVLSLSALSLSLQKDKAGETRLTEWWKAVNLLAEPGEKCAGTEKERS
jgi:hypothetical protein